jgi:hypothetical protein
MNIFRSRFFKEYRIRKPLLLLTWIKKPLRGFLGARDQGPGARESKRNFLIYFLS